MVEPHYLKAVRLKDKFGGLELGSRFYLELERAKARAREPGLFARPALHNPKA